MWQPDAVIIHVKQAAFGLLARCMSSMYMKGSMVDGIYIPETVRLVGSRARFFVFYLGAGGAAAARWPRGADKHNTQ